MVHSRRAPKVLNRHVRAIEEVVTQPGTLDGLDDGLREWATTYGKNHKMRLAADLAMLEEIADPSMKILEIGCVPPFLTFALRDLGFDVTGVDIAPERFPALRDAEMDIVKCDVEADELPFSDASFDLCIFNQLFEHLRQDLIFTARQLLRVLKPSGQLVLTTPNMRSLRGIHALVVAGRSAWLGSDIYKQYAKIEQLGHMGHVREYTPSDLRMFFEKIGFEIDQFLFRGSSRSRIERLVLKMRPDLRPQMIMVARRPVALI